MWGFSPNPQVPVPASRFLNQLGGQSMSRVGENEGRLAVQLACPALLTSQSRPPPGRALSQPLLDGHEASDCSVSFCIQVDEPPGRPFLLLTRNSSSRKSSEFAQGNWLRLDEQIQRSIPESSCQLSYQCVAA